MPVIKTAKTAMKLINHTYNFFTCVSPNGIITQKFKNVLIYYKINKVIEDNIF